MALLWQSHTGPPQNVCKPQCSVRLRFMTALVRCLRQAQDAWTPENEEDPRRCLLRAHYRPPRPRNRLDGPADTASRSTGTPSARPPAPDMLADPAWQHNGLMCRSSHCPACSHLHGTVLLHNLVKVSGKSDCRVCLAHRQGQRTCWTPCSPPTLSFFNDAAAARMHCCHHERCGRMT